MGAECHRNLKASISLGSSLGCVKDAISSVSLGSASTHNVVDIGIEDPTQIYHAVHTVLAYATRAATLPFASITFPIYLWCSPTWRRDSNLLRTFLFNKVVAARQRGGNLIKSDQLLTDADCVLDMLIQQEAREGSDTLSTNEIVDEMLCVFM